jgi:hypothetical protein
VRAGHKETPAATLNSGASADAPEESGRREEGPAVEATKIKHPSLDERRAQGKEARTRVPPSDHADWTPAADRPDPVDLLE